MRACTSVELEFSEVTDQICNKQTHRQPDQLTGDSQAGEHTVCAALRWMLFACFTLSRACLSLDPASSNVRSALRDRRKV